MLREKLKELARRPSRREELKTRLISNLIYCVAVSIGATVRTKEYGQQQVEQVIANKSGAILVTWHGRSFVPILYYRRRGWWSFISTSRDGNYQNRLFKILGWNTVRGSTSARGAVASALKMAKELRNGAVLCHTPDGPRGPIHVVHPGAIFLAEKSGCPIIPAGISASPAIQLRAWDSYIVPKLFSRAAIVFGEPIYVSPCISEDERAALCKRLGDEICRLEDEAQMYVERRVGVNAEARTISS